MVDNESPSWRTLTDEELEKQYSPSQWVRRIRAEDVPQDHVNTLTEASKRSRELVQYERIIYGPGEEQKIDVFGSESLPNDAPILVYIHGGYWQYLSLEISAHLAKTFHDRGVVVASIGYDLCPKVSFRELVEQVKKAILEVARIAHNRGSRGVYLTGHSAGGHLTALLLATDWTRDYQLDSSIIKGGVPMSGIFDLRPFCKNSDNKAVGLSEETAWQYSPWRMIDDLVRLNKSRKIKILVGEYDSPEFRRQSEDFAKALKDGGLNASIILMKSLDHFLVTEDLQNPAYEGTKILLQMMDVS